jgi:hypothetical protein
MVVKRQRMEAHQGQATAPPAGSDRNHAIVIFKASPVEIEKVRLTAYAKQSIDLWQPIAIAGQEPVTM